MLEKGKRYRIGYAFEQKKVVSFMKHSLIHAAAERGVDLVQIHLTKPLIDQGPFDCIIHKISDPDWTCQLLEFHSHNPSVVVIDSPDAIERLDNRMSMLEAVHELKISHKISVGVPKQVLVECPESALDSVSSNAMDFPLIVKTLSAVGSAASHQMFLVFRAEGLTGLEKNTSFVLQEFVNHGGVIFKVYVAGEHIICAKRRSLPDVVMENVDVSENMLSFSQISNSNMYDQSDERIASLIEAAEMPPSSFVDEVAIGLRQALNLSLFNFDMIKDNRVEDRYLIIDVNYFPGYAKIPCYEKVMTDFFLDVVGQKHDSVSDLSK